MSTHDEAMAGVELAIDELSDGDVLEIIKAWAAGDEARIDELLDMAEELATS